MRRLIAAAAILIVIGFVVFKFVNRADDEPTAHVSAAASAFPFPDRSAAGNIDRPAVADASAGYGALTLRLANPLEHSQSLRGLQEQYQSSANPAERNLAWRAWSACFPTFISASGAVPTLDSVTRALPENASNHAERIEAYRALMGRCKAFLDLPRDRLVMHTEQLKGAALSGTLDAPGDAARRLQTQGKTAEASAIARATVASGDAWAIGSLRDFIFARASDTDSGDQSSVRLRSDLRALAFSIAACDLGMACDANSLTAIELCAKQGQCGGTVQDRLLQVLPDQADRDAVVREAASVASAVRTRNFAALGIDTP